MALFTVFGNPIAQSLSPQIHQLFAEQAQVSLNYSRSLTSPAQFSRAVAAFFRSGGAGANVTSPFKQQAYQLVTHVTARAASAGSVNTIVALGHGQLLGDNTDGYGLVRDLQRLGFDLTQLTIVLLGAGGASRGCLQPLLDAGAANLVLANRTLSKAQQCVEGLEHARLSVASLAELENQLEPLQQPYLLINATSAGLHGDQLALAPAIFAQATACYDMSYSPNPSLLTPFRQQAQKAGAPRTFDGLGMLIEQADLAFQLWHQGIELDTRLVHQRLQQQLQQ